MKNPYLRLALLIVFAVIAIAAIFIYRSVTLKQVPVGRTTQLMLQDDADNVVLKTLSRVVDDVRTRDATAEFSKKKMG